MASHHTFLMLCNRSRQDCLYKYFPAKHPICFSEMYALFVVEPEKDSILSTCCSKNKLGKVILKLRNADEYTPLSINTFGDRQV